MARGLALRGGRHAPCGRAAPVPRVRLLGLARHLTSRHISCPGDPAHEANLHPHCRVARRAAAHGASPSGRRTSGPGRDLHARRGQHPGRYARLGPVPPELPAASLQPDRDGRVVPHIGRSLDAAAGLEAARGRLAVRGRDAALEHEWQELPALPQGGPRGRHRPALARERRLQLHRCRPPARFPRGRRHHGDWRTRLGPRAAPVPGVGSLPLARGGRALSGRAVARRHPDRERHAEPRERPGRERRLATERPRPLLRARPARQHHRRRRLEEIHREHCRA